MIVPSTAARNMPSMRAMVTIVRLVRLVEAKGPGVFSAVKQNSSSFHSNGSPYKFLIRHPRILLSTWISMARPGKVGHGPESPPAGVNAYSEKSPGHLKGVEA